MYGACCCIYILQRFTQNWWSSNRSKSHEFLNFPNLIKKTNCFRLIEKNPWDGIFSVKEPLNFADYNNNVSGTDIWFYHTQNDCLSSLSTGYLVWSFIWRLYSDSAFFNNDLIYNLIVMVYSHFISFWLWLFMRLQLSILSIKNITSHQNSSCPGMFILIQRWVDKI